MVLRVTPPILIRLPTNSLYTLAFDIKCGPPVGLLLLFVGEKNYGRKVLVHLALSSQVDLPIHNFLA